MIAKAMTIAMSLSLSLGPFPLSDSESDDYCDVTIAITRSVSTMCVLCGVLWCFE